MFLYPTLLGALALIALPILIHLINLFRHKRVKWAAMEFLLASHRKHSTWIRMRELLLLLCRIGIVALVVLAAAQPLVSDKWGNLLGGHKSHLIFLLDDSYSMQTRSGESSCFDSAKSAIAQFFESQNITPGQTVSVIAFSRPDAPILASTPVDVNFAQTLGKTLQGVFPAQRDDGPQKALSAAADWIEANPQESHRVFLISDFRTQNWVASNGKLSIELRKEIGRITDNKAVAALIDVSGLTGAADNSQNDKINLGIAALKPGAGTQAAGVPIPLEIEVVNHSSQAVKNVSVRLSADGKPIPAVLISSIAPGETGKTQFSVSFPQGGTHIIEAALSPDALETDNSRYCVLNVPGRISTLLIGSAPRDGSELPAAQQPDIRFIQTALEPGAPVDTGIACKVEDARFLNAAKLNEYKTVYFLNTRQFSPLAGENLINWLRSGGKAVVFLGDAVNSAEWNAWVSKNKELSGLKLGQVKTLAPDFLRKRPDMTVLDAPIFRIFEGEKNAFLASVNIQYYYELAAPAAVEKQTLAKLRNGAPLIVDAPVGRGSLVVFFTSAAPTWNNWGKGNPSFVVVLHQLQGMLLAREKQENDFTVGRPIEFPLDGSLFKETLSCTIPPPDNEAQLDEKSREISLVAKTAGNQWNVIQPDTNRAGIYKFTFEKRLGGAADASEKEDENQNANAGATAMADSKSVSVNVAPQEGNLNKLDLSEFSRQWSEVPLEISDSSAVSAALAGQQGFNIQAYCLYALGALLFLEMLVAYWASSHMSGAAVEPTKGVAR